MVPPEGARLPGSLTVVLPAHNEAKNLPIVVPEVLTTLPQFCDEFEVIVIDDGSQDGTRQLLSSLVDDHPRLRVERHEVNRGYGAALATGFRASSCDFVMFMDSDQQFKIEDLALLSPFVGQFDIVAGFRKERSDPVHRRIFAEIFNVTVRILFGVHLRDIDCAFKIFRGDQIRSLELSAPGALINTEIQAKLRRIGATLEQVGVNHYPRVAGHATGGSFRVIVRAMRETIVLWWQMRSYVPPPGKSERNQSVRGRAR